MYDEIDLDLALDAHDASELLALITMDVAVRENLTIEEAVFSVEHRIRRLAEVLPIAVFESKEKLGHLMLREGLHFSEAELFTSNRDIAGPPFLHLFRSDDYTREQEFDEFFHKNGLPGWLKGKL
ncbi:MAG: hypothetical protein MUE52_01010 [Tabrizicola sp.]|jgi:hypothetical protein|nr:hypothetical protein [Tabrizicola sp.]